MRRSNPASYATDRVAAAAGRGAGPAAAGAAGVSLGAAGDFLKRMRALESRNRAGDGGG